MDSFVAEIYSHETHGRLDVRVGGFIFFKGVKRVTNASLPNQFQGSSSHEGGEVDLEEGGADSV